MATITEDYVSFETAKLLKEKGFDAEIDTYYSPEGKFKIWCPNGLKSYLDNKGTETWWWKCIAPTLQMAMKWLREVHDIHIELNWDKGNQLYGFQIWKPGKFRPEISSLDLWKIYKDDNYLGEWIYEEACEAAIKYYTENLI